MFEAETLSVHILALKIYKCHVTAAELMNFSQTDLALKLNDCAIVRVVFSYSYIWVEILFYSNFNEVCSYVPNKEKISIGSGNGLVPWGNKPLPELMSTKTRATSRH